tara:strand:- start:5926 stop:6054 length:129 start_codon:yes stop_codon:yes gene_type:complete
VNNVLVALKTAMITVAITWLGIAMVMAIAMPVSITKKAKGKL